jgi:hypothetical protein
VVPVHPDPYKNVTDPHQNVTDPQHCLEEVTRKVEADQPRHEAQVPVAHLVQVIEAEAEEKLAQPHLHRVLGVVHNVLPKERLESNGGNFRVLAYIS